MTDILHPTWQKKRLGILCGMVTIAVLIATLWPCNFFPANRVSWLPVTNGIRFGDPGIVVSKAPLRTTGAGPTKECSLELLLRPANVEGSFTILGFSAPGDPNLFLVRQWTDGLLVTHEIVDAQNKLKRAKFDVDHAFRQDKLVLLTITSGPNGTVVYLDASRAQIFSRFKISQPDLSGQVVLGTSPVDYQPWPGEIHGLAIYSKELTPAEVLRHYRNWTDKSGLVPADLDGAIAHYAFAEGAGRDIHNAAVSGTDLEIPKRFAVPQKTMLKSPVKEFEATWAYFNDVLRNVVGFVPFGFVFCAYWGWTRTRGRAILYAVVAGGVLSFLIEVLQFYIPQRISGTTDIITNTLGAALGAMLARPAIIQKILERTKSITELRRYLPESWTLFPFS